MPLAQPPIRGYPDYQRVENWDSDVVWNPGQATGGAPVDSGYIDVSRFACLLFNPVVTVGQVVVSIVWSNDDAGNLQLGSLQWCMDAAIGSSGAYRHTLNQGPFARIFVVPISASATVDPIALVDNRTGVLDFTPFAPTLIDEQNSPLGANQTATLYPTGLYAGPVHTWFEPAWASGILTLDTLATDGTYHVASVIDIPGAGDQSYVQLTPVGAWRMRVENGTGAASSYYLSVVPSITGAS